jgi:hypothetical protein
MTDRLIDRVSQALPPSQDTLVREWPKGVRQVKMAQSRSPTTSKSRTISSFRSFFIISQLSSAQLTQSKPDHS